MCHSQLTDAPVFCLTFGFEFLRTDFYFLPPCVLITACPNTAGWCFPLLPWIEPPQLAGAWQVSHPSPVPSWGVRDCSKEMMWWSKENGLWSPIVLLWISALLLPTCVTLPKLLIQTDLHFPHQFHGYVLDWDERELGQAPGNCLPSLRAGCTNAGPGPLPGQGYMNLVLIWRALRPVHFFSFLFSSHELISPETRWEKQAMSKGPAYLAKVCCVSSAPSTHLVVLTDLKM